MIIQDGNTCFLMTLVAEISLFCGWMLLAKFWRIQGWWLIGDGWFWFFIGPAMSFNSHSLLAFFFLCFLTFKFLQLVVILGASYAQCPGQLLAEIIAVSDESRPKPPSVVDHPWNPPVTEKKIRVTQCIYLLAKWGAMGQNPWNLRFTIYGAHFPICSLLKATQLHPYCICYVKNNACLNLF